MTAQLLEIAGLFERLRRYDGLTSDRVTQSGACLETLDAVQDLAIAQGMSAGAAAVQVVRAVAATLAGSDRLIADAALRLQLLTDGGLLDRSAPLAKGLYSRSVVTRRKYLRQHWEYLHEIAGIPGDRTAPSDTEQRTTRERAAFERLAQLLVTTAGSPPRQNAAPGPASEKPVIVIGGAVMDVIFRLPKEGLPSPNTSAQVDELELHPGGKGLTQAVAAARLGMDVALVAAVGDDFHGQEIKAYLSAQGVNTDYLKMVPGERTPVTGVIVYPDGTSVALGWKNEDHLRISPADVTRGAIHAKIRNSDYLLLTFELPVKTVNETLRSVSQLPHRRPQVVVTPAPPYAARRLNPRHLHCVDLLVANDWECRMILPGATASTSVPDMAAEILRLGVRVVCVPADGQIFTFSTDEHIVVPAFPVFAHDNTGERDALCAAITYQHITSGNFSGREQLQWAAAAMATSSISPGVAATMPTIEEIGRTMKNFANTVF